jgi:hypothetical protein
VSRVRTWSDGDLGDRSRDANCTRVSCGFHRFCSFDNLSAMGEVHGWLILSDVPKYTIDFGKMPSSVVCYCHVIEGFFSGLISS